MRGGTGLLLVAAGALLVGASAERWTAPCPEGGPSGCELLQDHRYDVLPPGDPWEPVGRAAETAGSSLLVLATALALLPWALLGRRPGRVLGPVAALAAAATAVTGVALVRSGLAGERAELLLPGATVAAWLLLPVVLLTGLAVGAQGWSRATAILLLLGSPLVAAFTYALGPFDAQPWWEAWSGALVAAGGSCLLVAAARRTVSSLSDPPRPTTVSVTIGR